MKAYSTTGQGTTGTNKTILGITATALVRPRIFYIAVGSGGAVADATGIFEVKRNTTTGTSTAVVPVALDSANVACITISGENHSAEPTYTSATELLSFGLNQRATFQWWAYNDEAKIILPATANYGVGIKTLSHTGTPTADATFHFDE